ncbi:hypothetical protein B0T24DRAFT_114596 [Lasiosphaeria ovina]|uniref:Uncharacterized protein n=1 Tax=Lasiosphaeria ovina TaxID=92902 RepID=A0AAE0MYJ4_9PEZI|nr:hypothetical protein B0T24DRAFT_114596 [Lasiosphaeria ovina]
MSYSMVSGFANCGGLGFNHRSAVSGLCISVILSCGSAGSVKSVDASSLPRGSSSTSPSATVQCWSVAEFGGKTVFIDKQMKTCLGPRRRSLPRLVMQALAGSAAVGSIAAVWLTWRMRLTAGRRRLQFRESCSLCPQPAASRRGTKGKVIRYGTCWLMSGQVIGRSS